jgi:hypothetical protein
MDHIPPHFESVLYYGKIVKPFLGEALGCRFATPPAILPSDGTLGAITAIHLVPSIRYNLRNPLPQAANQDQKG